MTDHRVYMPTPERPVCDFCSAPDVHWSYPARDFEHHRELAGFALNSRGVQRQDIDLHAGSAGGWAACNVCHALIERSMRDKLVRRSAKRQQRIAREQGAIISLRNCIDLIRPIQDQFWANREGPPVPTDPDTRKDPTRA